ncbi:MAG: ferredoxin--NADP reductase [Cytophagaceae bacterium]|nr:ferredoxin--NADP reductase [Cytophagaceae bacterium]
MEEVVLRLRIKGIIRETPDVKTFVLEPTENRVIPYRAGQFLTVLLPLHGRDVRRSYSLSSSPEADQDLAITVKRVTNGAVSRHLLDSLRMGDELRCLPPAGRFTLDDASTDGLFLIGAGSGMTPLFSLLKTALHTQPHRKITLLDANRDARSAIFFNELNLLAQQHPDRLTVLHLFSTPSDGQPARRLNNHLLERLVRLHVQGDWSMIRFYVCGPPDFMRMVRITLRFMGFGPDQIRLENFVVEAIPVAEVLPTDPNAPPSRVTLIFRETKYHLAVAPGTYLLTAALAAGIPLPYSCRGGRCSACAARCLSGRVVMRINDVLTERDLAEGWVLTCTGHAESEEVVLSV